MQPQKRSIRFLIAATLLLLTSGAALYIIQQDLPYRPADVLLIVGVFPVVIALYNVDRQATYRQLLIDPINLAILLGCGSFIGMLLLAIDIPTARAVLAAAALIPAYGLLIWLVHRIAAARGGFGLFNLTLALFFLPLIGNDSNLATWNALAPTWVDLLLTGVTPKSLILLVVYLTGLFWGLPLLLPPTERAEE